MKVYIITSAKFEECYIEEWVIHHLNLGFDKIIINDNNPKDYPYDVKDILKKYINNNQVIVERYYDHFNMKELEGPDDDLEFNIYTWLYNKYKDEFDWVAKFDIDEYLEIPETHNDIKKFLNQNKFDNVLSIIIPWKVYKVKDEYSDYYTRLKNNRDRFIYDSINADQYKYKSIIRKHKYVYGIGLHYAKIDGDFTEEIIKRKLITFAFPDGINATKKTGIFTDNYKFDELVNNTEYFENIVNNICCINHYCVRSNEEEANHMIKFNTNEFKTWWLYEEYVQFYNIHKEMFDHPRDLYKIYFIDDINHIND